MRTRDRRGVWIVVALLAGARAGAQTRTPAQEAWERGTRELEAHRYVAAIEALEASYRIDPVAVVLFNLGLAHEGVGHVRAAIETYERYLATARDVPTPRADALRNRVAQLRASLCTIAVEGADGAVRLRVDGREEPLVDGFARIDPGERVIELDAPGHVSLRQTVRLAPGARQSLRLDVSSTPVALSPSAAPAPPDAPPRVTLTPAPTPHPRAPVAPAGSPSIASRWWFWTVIGAVVVAGVAAGLTAGLSRTADPVGGTAVDIETITVAPRR